MRWARTASDLNFDGTGSKSIVKLRRHNDFAAQPFDLEKLSKSDHVLKTYCVRWRGVKTLMHCFPPKLSQHAWPEVSSPALRTVMNSNVVITTVLIPGFVSVLLFLVFTYLHEQSRQPYFRAWKWAWAFYSLHYVLDTFPASAIAFFVRRAFPGGDGAVHFRFDAIDARPFAFRWYDAAVAAIGVVLASLTLRGHMVNGVFRPTRNRLFGLGVGLAVILLYCSAVFYVNGHRRGSLAFQVLAGSLALVGGADGGGATAESAGGKFRQRQPAVRPGAADAAGHRHGDGAV